MYDNSNSGALFREIEKKNPKGPDYSGMITIDGREYRLAAWFRDSKKGTRSLKVTDKDYRARDEAPAKEENDLEW